MYYFELLKILEDEGCEVEGMQLKQMFIDKFGSGSVINMNKALRKLARNKKVLCRRQGFRLYYKPIKR